MPEDDGKVRFCIEASNNQIVDDVARTEYYHTHAEATTAYEHLSRDYVYVWLSEFGLYRLDGREVKDWIYYKWTAATDYGEMAGRFQGYPEQDLERRVDYVECTRDGRRI